jgi:DNA repair protein RadC
VKHTADNKHIHAGHRKRLRDLVDNVGLENLSEVQALEFALTYVLPRRNTNEIAHELISVFGSFYAVLNAPYQQLKEIKFLGPDSAKMLSQLKSIFNYYNYSQQMNQKQLENILQINAYFYNFMLCIEKECFYAMALDDKGNIKAIKRLAVGSDKLVTFEISELASFMYASKARNLVIAHNHPGASCMPSKNDDLATGKIKTWINTIGMRLVEHVVVGREGTFSFEQVKIFSSEELKDVFS